LFSFVVLFLSPMRDEKSKRTKTIRKHAVN